LPAHVLDEFLNFGESLLVDFNRLLMASKLLGAVLHLPFFLIHADSLASFALTTMEVFKFFAEVAEVGLALRADLIISCAHLFNLDTTLVVGARLGISLLVYGIKAMLVFASVALVGHWIENIHAREAPLYSALAVDILATRS